MVVIAAQLYALYADSSQPHGPYLLPFEANGFSPGYVDVGVHRLCDWVCASWNASLEIVSELKSSACEEILSSNTSEAALVYEEVAQQKSCLVSPSAGVGDLPWVTPTWATEVYAFDPSAECSANLVFSSPGTSQFGSGICGACTPPGFDEPLGNWTQYCDETEYIPASPGSGNLAQLSAKCSADETATRQDRTVASSQSCNTGHWTIDGSTAALACELPPGSWKDSCAFSSFSGATLCASCPGGEFPLCATCPTGRWAYAGGRLLCDQPGSTTQQQQLRKEETLGKFSADNALRSTLLIGSPRTDGGIL